MKRIFQAIGLGMALLLWASAQAELQSLRDVSIESDSMPSEVRRYIKDDQLVERNFVQQPPLIPHSIEGYRVNLRENKCLSCHSWANYKKKKAVKISITHFRDRDGNELADVAGTRYFCPQCHVPQVGMPALVENRFQPVDALKSE
uniref:Periplasmic nitrate reductase, electron transfer subunit n=1 Tax=Candidatus Kentrum sp. FW TaxID=2126338 RepID=A0A450TZF0_9GAMM|nr:MAG: periplasmic nitrate reductase subunit NapB [Candidatus Kentron sp. FW]